jgi:hypothetical protein
VVGAARSGTNALRDALTSFSQFTTWPCDEINPIWRHGNALWPNDEIPVEGARPAVRRYIRRAFVRLWRQTGRMPFVVEKTCANSLRVPFLERVLPEARYIYIVRNGVDVVASALKRWRGELELPTLRYFLAKARYVPPTDLPYYITSFLTSRSSLFLGRKKHLAVWGPRFAGMEQYLDSELEALCARQWAACVARSDAAFRSIDKSRLFSLRYEDFTAQPATVVSEILSFLGTGASKSDISDSIAPIRASSVGKGQDILSRLSPDILLVMECHMRRHGYVG